IDPNPDQETQVALSSATPGVGETITVTGSGFTADQRLTIAQTLARPVTGFPIVTARARTLTTDGSGTFTTTLTVDRRVAGTDCTAAVCYIATFVALPQGVANRSQDNWTPIRVGGAPAREPETTPAGPNTGTPGTPDQTGRADQTGRTTTPTPGTQNPKPQNSRPQTPKPQTPRPSRGNGAGGPAVSLSKITGLNPNGDEITVSGTGFSGAGAGIYVGIAQDDQFSTTDASVYGPGTVFVRSSQMSGGSWSTRLKVSATFASADCQKRTCSVYTLAAHGSSDRSQDTKTPVSFTSARVTKPAQSARGRNRTKPGQKDGTPAVSVSQASGLDPRGSKVTISGTGFSGAGAGVYVGLVQDSLFSTTDASGWGAVAFVTPVMMSGGAWSTTLTLKADYGKGNCLRNPCSIHTIAAHGSSDRSQDTSTPVTFDDGSAQAKIALGTATLQRGGAGRIGVSGAKPGDRFVTTITGPREVAVRPVVADGKGTAVIMFVLGDDQPAGKYTATVTDERTSYTTELTFTVAKAGKTETTESAAPAPEAQHQDRA
ncbi:MAG: neocarzinostatin apoprotein domain-containing protein, partial [Gordonia amarae]